MTACRSPLARNQTCGSAQLGHHLREDLRVRRLNDDVADPVGVPIAADPVGHVARRPGQDPRVSQQFLVGQVGQEAAGDLQVRHSGTIDGHRRDRDVQLQLVEPVSCGVADELDPFGERIIIAGWPVASGEADDVGVPRRDGQQSVAIARDQNRHIGAGARACTR